MRQRWMVLLALTSAALGLVACGGDCDATTADGDTESVATPTDAGELDGRIAFVRGDPEEGESVTYTVNPDGSDEEQLFFDGPSEGPRWSPDGTEIQIFCCDRSTVSSAATSRTHSEPGGLRVTLRFDLASCP
jgi:hypothetical protein